MTYRLITPKGYRRLRVKEKRRIKDYVWSWGAGPWVLVSDGSVGVPFHSSDYPVIRRKPGHRLLPQ